jgi:hippurate hydrolase
MCEFHAGHAHNVIPGTATLTGTVRTLKAQVRDLMEKRMKEVVAGVALQTGAKIVLHYDRGYPVVVNHPAETDMAVRIASEVAGAANVNADMIPIMGAEDFAYMLEARPGAFIFLGNGPSAGLHHPAYNFNDDAIVFGTSYWVKLVETTLAA